MFKFSLFIPFFLCFGVGLCWGAILLKNMDEYNFPATSSKILRYMFDNKSCIQLFFDNTAFSLGVVKNLYTEQMFGAIAINPPEDFPNCKNVIVASETLVIAFMKPIPLYYGYKVFFLIEKSSIDSFWLSNESAAKLVFRDAEGIIYIVSRDIMFSRVQPRDNLQEVKNLTGKWIEREQEIKNFLGKPLNVASFNCNVFSSLGPLDEFNTPGWIEGPEATIVSEVTKHFNLTWVTHVPKEQNKWGQLVGLNWDGGILRLIQLGKADIAFCGLWMEDSMVKTGLEMSDAVGWECLKFLVPRPKPKTTGWTNIFKPFQIEVWICILLLFLFSIIFVYTFSWATCHWYHQHTDLFSIDACVFEVISIFIVSTSTRKVYGALRFLIFVFIFLNCFVSACFSSGLFSQLTMPLYTEKMDTIEQLVRNDYYWTTSIFPDSTLMFDLSDPWEAAWRDRYRPSVTWSEIQELHDKTYGKLALVGLHIEKGLNVDDDYPANLIKNYEASSICHKTKGIAVGFRKGSPFVGPFNDVLRRFHAAGLVNKLIDKSFYLLAPSMPYVYELLEFEKSHLTENISLSLRNLEGVFHVFCVGLMLSVTVFLIELIIKKYNDK